MKSSRENDSVYKKKAMGPTFSKKQQWHNQCSMLNQTQAKNKLGKVYQRKSSGIKAKNPFFPEFWKIPKSILKLRYALVL